MFILHITTSRTDGRAESYAAALIRGLHQSGVPQGVVMDARATHYTALKKEGVTMAPHVLGGRWQLRQAFLLRRLIAQLKPVVIHCWTRAAARLVPSCGIPVIVWLGGHDDPRLFAPHVHFAAVTEDIAAGLIRWNVARERVHAIPVFSDLSASPPLDRNRLATPTEAKVLLSFSRLHPANRFDLLLTAMRDLPGCYAWLADQDLHRRELEKQAIAAGLIDRVRFAGAGTDRAALLRAADLCVLPALDESLGTIVQDAWAVGTPLVAIRRPALALLRDEAAGLLATDGNAPALTCALRRVLDDEVLRRRLIAQGYAIGLNSYTREAVMRRWINLYQRLGRAVAIGGRERMLTANA